MDEDGFVIVKPRKGKSRPKERCKSIKQSYLIQPIHNQKQEITDDVDENEYCKSLRKLEDEICYSQFFLKFVTSIGLQENQNSKAAGFDVNANKNLLYKGCVSKIICLGLGHFATSRSSKYQLAFLRCIAKLLGFIDEPAKHAISIFDPIHTTHEINIIKYLGYTTSCIDENFEKNYAIENSSGVLFYLPHCSKHITNTILWANWHPTKLGSEYFNDSMKATAGGLYILGNSFERTCTNLPDSLLKKTAE
jgi:hypothetical protein